MGFLPLQGDRRIRISRRLPDRPGDLHQPRPAPTEGRAGKRRRRRERRPRCPSRRLGNPPVYRTHGRTPGRPPGRREETTTRSRCCGAKRNSSRGRALSYPFALATSLSTALDRLDLDFVRDINLDQDYVWGWVGHYVIGRTLGSPVLITSTKLRASSQEPRPPGARSGCEARQRSARGRTPASSQAAVRSAGRRSGQRLEEQCQLLLHHGQRREEASRSRNPAIVGRTTTPIISPISICPTRPARRFCS